MSDYKYIQVSQNDDVTVVRFAVSTLQDQLIIEDLSNELVDMIEQSIPKKLLIIFDGVTYFSSAMLSGLLKAKTRLSKVGGRIRLAGMMPKIRQIFDASKLEKVFDIDDTQSQAIEAFAAS